MTRQNLRIAIIVLTVATAVIHLYLNFNTGAFVFQPMFTLNALGYLGLMVAFFNFVSIPFLQGRRKLLWYVYMGYTAITLIGYFVVNGAESLSNPVGLVDKIIELLLLVALWLHKEN